MGVLYWIQLHRHTGFPPRSGVCEGGKRGGGHAASKKNDRGRGARRRLTHKRDLENEVHAPGGILPKKKVVGAGGLGGGGTGEP